MIDLQALALKIDKKEVDNRQMLDYISDVINLKFKDPLVASRYLPLFGKYYLVTQDNIIKPLFYLCEEFKIFDNVIIQRYVCYTLFLVYYILPHYPKAIEYGLELEKIGYNYPFMEINNNNFMAIMCFNLNLYEETIKYNQKSLESVSRFFDVESEIYQKFTVVYLNNLLFINTKNKNQEQAKQNVEEINSYLKTIKRDSFRINLTNYSSFTIMYYRSVFEKVEPNEYIDAVMYFRDHINLFPPNEMTMAVHNELINLLDDPKYLIPSFEICSFLIKCDDLIGDKSIVYLKLLNLLENSYDSTDIVTLKKILTSYKDIARDHYKYQHFISSVVAMENFKVSSIESRIQKVDDKMSKDFLTGCYNRFVLSTDWEEIYSKLNDGGTLTFIDIDNLKHINDSFGHESGDNHLVKITSKIREKFHDTSRIYRFGGDEFIILSDMKEDETIKLLDGIISEFAKESNISSFSYGTQSFNKNDNFDEIIKRADEKMYVYKKANKLRITGVGAR